MQSEIQTRDLPVHVGLAKSDAVCRTYSSFASPEFSTILYAPDHNTALPEVKLPF
jgi:hypothetical protein